MMTQPKGIDRLDQQITVTVNAPGTYVNGIYQEGTATDYSTWAGYMDRGIGAVLDRDGVRETGEHRFKVRYRQAFLDATPLATITVTFRGSRYPVQTILEDRRERSRFLFLDCKREE